MKRSKFTCCLLQSASYLWLQVLIACFPGKPQTIAPNLGPAEAAESNVGQTLSQDSMSDGNLVHIDLGVAKGSQEPKPLLALVAAIDEVEYQLTGCISGKTKTWVAGPGASLDLYKFDQLCRISLKRLRIVSVDYSMPAGISFNSSLNAVNAMQSSTGKIIYVKVQNQLPDILLANNYSSSFIINETNGGLDEAVPIYQVGISVNQTQIAEGAGLHCVNRFSRSRQWRAKIQPS